MSGPVRWSGEVEITAEDENDVLIFWRAQVSCYAHPGRTYGPPENCFPPESDFEMWDVEKSTDEENWVEVDNKEVPQHVEDQLEEAAFIQARNQDDD